MIILRLTCYQFKRNNRFTKTGRSSFYESREVEMKKFVAVFGLMLIAAIGYAQNYHITDFLP
ncbi:MAG: hypothetical protein V1681_00095, partial [Candidatus Neomarinimicrobiota bacterium]